MTLSSFVFFLLAFQFFREMWITQLVALVSCSTTNRFSSRKTKHHMNKCLFSLNVLGLAEVSRKR